MKGILILLAFLMFCAGAVNADWIKLDDDTFAHETLNPDNVVYLSELQAEIAVLETRLTELSESYDCSPYPAELTPYCEMINDDNAKQAGFINENLTRLKELEADLLVLP